MGTRSSQISSSNSESSASDNDSTWFLAGDIQLWEERYMRGASFGDTTLFMGGPEFTVREVEDPPEPTQFAPKFTSSQLELRQLQELQELNSSYDRIPQPAEPLYPHKASPVRGRARKRLPGWDCEKCNEYYQAAGLTKENICKCSKHRSKYPRSRSPKWLWDLNM